MAALLEHHETGLADGVHQPPAPRETDHPILPAPHEERRLAQAVERLLPCRDRTGERARHRAREGGKVLGDQPLGQDASTLRAAGE